MAERLLVRKISKSLWQWRQATSNGEWQNDAHYSGDINLLKEAADGRAVWLYLPGANIVTQSLDMDVKDRKLLAKLVPFEVEESVVDSIVDLAFAYGPNDDGRLSVGHVNFEIACQAIEEVERIGADVQHCIPDYLGLTLLPGTVSILLENDMVLVRTHNGVGFAVEKELAAVYLESHFEQELPAHIVLTASDSEELSELRGFLPALLDDMDDIEIEASEGSYWDAFSLEQAPILDFRTGSLARKLPFEQWWHDWKVPAIAAGIAFVVAVGASWYDVKQGREELRQIFADRDAIYRQAIPKGAISDPIRQLKSKLSPDVVFEPSNFVELMHQVSQPISANDKLTLSNVRYNHDNGQLRLSLEAKEFELFEELRGKIDSMGGLRAEIKRSSAAGDIQTAQMIVSTGGKS